MEGVSTFDSGSEMGLLHRILGVWTAFGSWDECPGWMKHRRQRHDARF